MYRRSQSLIQSSIIYYLYVTRQRCVRQLNSVIRKTSSRTKHNGEQYCINKIYSSKEFLLSGHLWYRLPSQDTSRRPIDGSPDIFFLLPGAGAAVKWHNLAVRPCNHGTMSSNSVRMHTLCSRVKSTTYDALTKQCTGGLVRTPGVQSGRLTLPRPAQVDLWKATDEDAKAALTESGNAPS